MPDRPYVQTWRDGVSVIRCLTCQALIGPDLGDCDLVYLRLCHDCGLLGPEIRQKWDAHIPHLRDLIEQFGRYKKVQLFQEATARKVPTERIITEGIRGIDLPSFPPWEDE